ncbi:MAG TPA: dTDP-4-dehydrorhamnose reductase, partial [Rhodothermia bacterium]|nr:dTDP-4-dehydrorhamnose reductase [Rhodothermia bacterium]
MKRLMVTGANGMTGSEVSERAAGFGWTVLPYSHAKLDITRVEDVTSAVQACRPDIIANCAGYTAVDRAESEPALAAAVNAEGARNIARAAAVAGVPIIHVSTDYVFAGDARAPYAPDSITAPSGIYGRTKLEGEAAVREATRSHMIIRTSWVFSHRGHNFVKTIMRLAAERDELRVVNDQFGRPTSAADLAQALLVAAGALAHDPAYEGTYHFANAGETTWFDFAKGILEELRAKGENLSTKLVPISTSEYPTAARRPRYSVLDTSSFTERFGVVPRPW